MASSDSQIDKPQCGCPRRAELPDVNINTGMHSIHTKSFLFSALSSNSDKRQLIFYLFFYFITFAIKTAYSYNTIIMRRRKKKVHNTMAGYPQQQRQLLRARK